MIDISSNNFIRVNRIDVNVNLDGVRERLSARINTFILVNILLVIMNFFILLLIAVTLRLSIYVNKLFILCAIAFVIFGVHFHLMMSNRYWSGFYVLFSSIKNRKSLMSGSVRDVDVLGMCTIYFPSSDYLRAAADVLRFKVIEAYVDVNESRLNMRCEKPKERTHMNCQFPVNIPLVFDKNTCDVEITENDILVKTPVDNETVYVTLNGEVVDR